MKYSFNVYDNKVVCVSHFAGKAVRGFAKCDETCDKFNMDTGMKLSQKRCDVKVAKKRVKRATMKLNKAIEELQKANSLVMRMHEYKFDAEEQLKDLEADLAEFENALK